MSFPAHACRPYALLRSGSFALFTLGLQAVLLARVLALYHHHRRRRWLTRALLAFYALEAALLAVAEALYARRPLAFDGACMPVGVAFPGLKWMLALVAVPPFALDFALLALTVCRALALSHRTRSPLTTVLLRDGTWAFVSTWCTYST
jgi:hypothetical protein